MDSLGVGLGAARDECSKMCAQNLLNYLVGGHEGSRDRNKEELAWAAQAH